MEVGAEEEVQHPHVEEGEEGEGAAVLAEPGAKTSRGTRGRGAGCDTNYPESRNEFNEKFKRCDIIRRKVESKFYIYSSEILSISTS